MGEMPKVEVDPQRKLSEALQEAAKKVSDLTIPLHSIAQSWFKSNNAIFSLKGPGKYPPFKNSTRTSGSRGMDVEKSPYQKWKIKKFGFDYPLLFATGALAKSITDPTDESAVNYIINKVSLAVGTAVPYAIYHQSKMPRAIMPYRPMILFGNEQVAPGALAGRVKQWREQIFDHVAKVSGVRS